LIKRFVTLWLILLAVGVVLNLEVRQIGIGTPVAHGQAATPTPTPAYCTITGNVLQADGTPLVNGVITFNSQRIQVINGIVINPTNVTTNTDVNGLLRAITFPQGLAAQVVVCPPATGQGQSANCAAPFAVIIPFSQTATFGQLAQGVTLTSSGALNLATLNVTQQITYPDGSISTTNGMNKLGIGQAAGSDPLDITGNVNGVTEATITNTNAGTNAQTGFSATNGSSTVEMNQLGASWATSGGYIANEGLLQETGVGGLYLYAANASANVKFAANGQNPTGSLNLSEDASGNFKFTPSNGTGALTIAAHLLSSGGSPVPDAGSACPSANLTVVAGSTDTMGRVSMGNPVTGCTDITIDFAQAFGSTPTCVVMSEGTAGAGVNTMIRIAPSTTKLEWASSSTDYRNITFDYICGSHS